MNRVGPSMIPLPPLLVCERTGLWAAAIRANLLRTAVDGRPRIVETRSFVECRRRFEVDATSESAFAPLVVEADSTNFGAVLDLLTAHLSRRPRVPRIVVGAGLSADAEAAFREAGAIAYVASPRELGPLVEVFRRYVSRHAELTAVHDEEMPITVRLRASFPWRPVT
ncbi:MAG: hypothetical protein QM775_05610 [Pirellulales bacterium]